MQSHAKTRTLASGFLVAVKKQISAPLGTPLGEALFKLSNGGSINWVCTTRGRIYCVVNSNGLARIRAYLALQAQQVAA